MPAKSSSPAPTAASASSSPRQYSADGWDVIATARKSSPELDALGVRVEQLDMLRPRCRRGASASRIDALDLLIANAGTVDSGAGPNRRGWPRVDGDADDEHRGALPTRQVRPAPRSPRTKGKMIALTSGMGSIAESSGGYVPYRSSKAALNMAWHSLAIEVKRQGVVAAVLDPGWVKTRMGGANAPTPPEQSVAEMRRLIERLGPGDIRWLLPPRRIAPPVVIVRRSRAPPRTAAGPASPALRSTR